MTRAMSRATLLRLAITSSVVALPAVARGQAQALNVGGSASETYAEPYYGLDAGIFTRAGLDVQVAAFPNGASIAQAVISGAIDVGLTDPIQVANATIRNVPILFVAPGVLYTSLTPTTALCVS